MAPGLLFLSNKRKPVSDLQVIQLDNFMSLYSFVREQAPSCFVELCPTLKGDFEGLIKEKGYKKCQIHTVNLKF